MSKHQRHRVNRRTAKRLLRGAPVAVPDALAVLLAAAAAPPHDGEQDGERAAVTAFVEAAHHTHVPRPRSRSMIKATLVKLLTVKVMAAAAAIFAIGGVTAVAATGHLTLPTGGAPASSTSSHPAAGSSAGGHTMKAGATMSSVDHQVTPSPSLVGLCHAYTAGAGSSHGKALDNPAFTALITAAGGMTKVDGYCTTLLDPITPTSTPPGKSVTGHQANTDHPTGPPSTHRTGAPNTHPTNTPNGHSQP